MLYGTECWAIKKNRIYKMSLVERRMLRWMNGKTQIPEDVKLTALVSCLIILLVVTNNFALQQTNLAFHHWDVINALFVAPMEKGVYQSV